MLRYMYGTPDEVNLNDPLNDSMLNNINLRLSSIQLIILLCIVFCMLMLINLLLPYISVYT